VKPDSPEAAAGPREPAADAPVAVLRMAGGALLGTVQGFSPREASFELCAAQGSQRVAFEDVLRVEFLCAPGAASGGFSPHARLVTLGLRDESIFYGVCENFGGPRSGVFLTPLCAEPVERVYVPGAAIRDVFAVQRLGDVCPGAGPFERAQVRAALEAAAERQAPGRGAAPRGAALDSETPTLVALQEGERLDSLLGEILVEQGFISPEELAQALLGAKRYPGKRVGELLVQAGYTSAKMIAIALSLQYRLPFVSLSGYAVDHSLRDLLSQDEALRWQVLPLALEGARLTVAIADPLQLEFRKTLRARTQAQLAQVIATPQDVLRGIEELYRD
jgi:hypothetical protein